MIDIKNKEFTYNPDAQLLADYVNYKDLAKDFTEWVKKKQKKELEKKGAEDENKIE